MVEKFRLLKEHKGFIKYFKNTSWLLSEKILRIIVGLFVGIWVARYLGPEQFGLFSYVQSFVGLFTVIATLGLDSIVIRELVKDETKRDKLLGTAFCLKLIGAFLVLFILYITINFIENDSKTNILVFIIAGSTIFQSFNVVDFYFQSKIQSKFVVYANIISLLMSSIVKVTLLLNEASLVAFAWVILFDSFILSCGFIYFYMKNNLSLLKWKFDKIIAIELLKDSWPLILSAVVISVYMKVDQIMIKEILGNEQVGQYAVAVRLSEIWYFIPMAIVSSLFPAIVNAKKESKELYYSRLQKLYDLMVWMAIAIALPMTFLSDWIVDLLYGSAYIEAGSVLMIHIWAGVFVFLGVAFSSFLASENLTKKAFYRTLLGAIINIILNYILIPIYGIMGAAIATLIGQFVANYIYDIFDSSLHQQLKMKSMSFIPIHIFKGYK